jgi:methyl-accepting chemotaxis protein
VARNIERAIGGEPEYAADIAKGIAAGDLTIDVHTRENDQDSLLFAMKSMRQSLAKVVGEVRQSTDMIATASSEIAQAIWIYLRVLKSRLVHSKKQRRPWKS